jgi:hypothetical protein
MRNEKKRRSGGPTSLVLPETKVKKKENKQKEEQAPCPYAMVGCVPFFAERALSPSLPLA